METCAMFDRLSTQLLTRCIFFFLSAFHHLRSLTLPYFTHQLPLMTT